MGNGKIPHSMASSALTSHFNRNTCITDSCKFIKSDNYVAAGQASLCKCRSRASVNRQMKTGQSTGFGFQLSGQCGYLIWFLILADQNETSCCHLPKPFCQIMPIWTFCSIPLSHKIPNSSYYTYKIYTNIED